MKYEQEITVSVNVSRQELINFLESNNYKKIDDYRVDDIYYVANETDLNQKTIEILKKCILIRSINNEKHYLMYKYKEYDLNENIINQGKTKVRVYSRNAAKTFMQTIGYKELINVIDDIVVYEKDGLELCVEYVNDRYLYIEVEESKHYNTIDKMIDVLEKTNIDYDKTNYFVKKAKVVFEERI